MAAGPTNTRTIVRKRTPPGAGRVGGIQRGGEGARPHATLNHSLLSGSGQAWTSAVDGLIALGLSTYLLLKALPREARA